MCDQKKNSGGNGSTSQSEIKCLFCLGSIPVFQGCPSWWYTENMQQPASTNWYLPCAEPIPQHSGFTLPPSIIAFAFNKIAAALPAITNKLNWRKVLLALPFPRRIIFISPESLCHKQFQQNWVIYHSVIKEEEGNWSVTFSRWKIDHQSLGYHH